MRSHTDQIHVSCGKYVKNKEADLRRKTGQTPHVSGMLLYAAAEDPDTPRSEYRMSGNEISVRTLDLSLEFSQIRAQLDGIAEKYFPLPRNEGAELQGGEDAS